MHRRALLYGLLCFIWFWHVPAKAQNEWVSYADDAEQILFGGGWDQVAIGAAAGGTLTYNLRGGEFLLIFEGTGLQLLHSSGVEGGEFSLTLYDVFEDVLDEQASSSYSPTYEYGHVVGFENLIPNRYVVILKSQAFWLEEIRVNGVLLAGKRLGDYVDEDGFKAEDRTAELLPIINEFRCQFGEVGIKQVTYSYELFTAAAGHTQNMAEYGFADHINPLDKSTPYDRMMAQGYRDANILAENIAVGNAQLSATFQQWLDSTQGHREIMLDPTITEIGLAYMSDPRLAEGHYWTLNMGNRFSEIAPECPATAIPVANQPVPRAEAIQRNNTVTLTWQLSLRGASYEIAYDTDPNGEFLQTLLTTNTTTSLNSILESDPTTTYYFKVRAFNPSTNSFTSYSNTVMAGGGGYIYSPVNYPPGYNPYDNRAPYDIELAPIEIRKDLFLPYYSMNIPAPPNRNAPNVPYVPGQITGTVWATEGLQLREAPSLYSEVIRVLLPGETFPILRRSNDGFWVELAVDGGRAWAHSHWITFNGSRFNIPTEFGFRGIVAFVNTGIYAGCQLTDKNRAIIGFRNKPAQFGGFWSTTQTVGVPAGYTLNPETLERIPIRAAVYLQPGHHVNVLGEAADGDWIRVYVAHENEFWWTWKACFTDAHTYQELGPLPIVSG